MQIRSHFIKLLTQEREILVYPLIPTFKVQYIDEKRNRVVSFKWSHCEKEILVFETIVNLATKEFCSLFLETFGFLQFLRKSIIIAWKWKIIKKTEFNTVKVDTFSFEIRPNGWSFFSNEIIII